jgi:hypothetical protein
MPGEGGAVSSQSIEHIVDLLLARARATDYAGYDPFDGLNSSLVRFVPFGRNRYFQLAWLQLHKRLPINTRSWVGIPRVRNPKALAIFVLALLQKHKRTGDPQALEEANRLCRALCESSVDSAQWPGRAWGYPFPWQARAFFVPVGVPNAIATIYAALALWAAADATGTQDYADAAAHAGVFLDEGLFVDAGADSFFRYIPREAAFVHNVNLWAAAVAARSARQLSNGAQLDRALTAMRHSVRLQDRDGSWLYGALPHHRFIDSFHSGYNVEALAMVRRSVSIDEFYSAEQRGLDYFRRTFIERNGDVRYYDNERYPIDCHCVAQAILTLLRVGGSAADIELAQRIARRAIESLFLPNSGHFAYQRTAWFTNKIEYLRWTQAWMCYSFATLANYSRAAID